MKVTNFRSSTVASFDYDPVAHTLDVTFKSGGAPYRYADVPTVRYLQLLEAPSKGVFLHTQIKPHYSVVRLEKPPETTK